MVKHEHQLRNFLHILQEYPADRPLYKFLPGFFQKNKQMGSSDRKASMGLLYRYFRIGKACLELPVQERLFLAEFLCSQEGSPFLTYFKPELATMAHWSLAKKISWLEHQEFGFQLVDVFPLHTYLSKYVDKTQFIHALLVQPDLFIRVRPERMPWVKLQLNRAHVKYHAEDVSTLRLANSTPLNKIFKPGDGSFEIQDLSSQKVGDLFKPKKGETWWDACAGSGGKSLLLKQKQLNLSLLVSDYRASILSNLRKRFYRAGLKEYEIKRCDLTKFNQTPVTYAFDGILLDVPCTGSGTWGRSPEMISLFNPEQLASFQARQQVIANNVSKCLKSKKPMIYITCSVFKQENEEVVTFIKQQLGFEVEQVKLFPGYQKKADTMFVARLLAP